MTAASRNGGGRAPRAFKIDDPRLDLAPPDPIDHGQLAPAGLDDAPVYRPGWQDGARGSRWGVILLGALVSLGMLSAGVWFSNFVAQSLSRQDWVGWTALALLVVAGLAAFAIIIREITGLLRLRSLRRFRDEVETAIDNKDGPAERRAVTRLKAFYRSRDDMTWALDRLKHHEGDIRDAGELMTLAERDLMVPLDAQAQAMIIASAKKVSLATAISPAAILDILVVLAENLSLLRRLASLYGARPGALGKIRLAKSVATHIIATGGLALTDDLFGQFLGQDLVRRMSRRLGEGLFNGALTARVGIAAIEVLRPLPFIESGPPRLRDLIPLIWRKPPEAQAN